MKAYEGVGIQLLPFLLLTLGGHEWPTSNVKHFTVRERVPNTHWILYLFYVQIM